MARKGTTWIGAVLVTLFCTLTFLNSQTLFRYAVQHAGPGAPPPIYGTISATIAVVAHLVLVAICCALVVGCARVFAAEDVAETVSFRATFTDLSLGHVPLLLWALLSAFLIYRAVAREAALPDILQVAGRIVTLRAAAYVVALVVAVAWCSRRASIGIGRALSLVATPLLTFAAVLMLLERILGGMMAAHR